MPLEPHPTAVQPVQPVQEPVARVAEVHMSRYTIEWTNGSLPEGTELFAAPTPPLPVQKPVAWMVKLGDVTCFQHHADSKHASVPLFTASPKQRQPLAASEILNMMPGSIPAEYDGPLMEFARAIEAKLKEPDHG